MPRSTSRLVKVALKVRRVRALGCACAHRVERPDCRCNYSKDHAMYCRGALRHEAGNQSAAEHDDEFHRLDEDVRQKRALIKKALCYAKIQSELQYKK